MIVTKMRIVFIAGRKQARYLNSCEGRGGDGFIVREVKIVILHSRTGVCSRLYIETFHCCFSAGTLIAYDCCFFCINVQ